MKTIWDWMKKHLLKTLLIALGIILALIAPPYIVHAMYKAVAKNPYFESTWSSGDLITYIAGFEAFIGTIFLGIVAERQNSKANKISTDLLILEIKRSKFERKPLIAINDCSAEFVASKGYFEKIQNSNCIILTQIEVVYTKDALKSKYMFLSFSVSNISKNPVECIFCSITVQSRIDASKATSLEVEVLRNNNRSNLLLPNVTQIYQFVCTDTVFFSKNACVVNVKFALSNSIGEKYVCDTTFLFIYINQQTCILSFEGCKVEDIN